MAKSNVLKLIQQTLTKTLQNRWFYFDGHHWFNAQGQQVEPQRGWVTVVVARQCYKTSERKWPIKSKSELLKVVRMQQPASLYQISDFQNGQRTVSGVKLSPDVDAALASVRFVIPEHWLLSASQNDNSFLSIQNSKGRWFSAKAAGRYTQTIESHVVNSAEDAKAVMGVSSAITVEDVDFQNLLQRLLAYTSAQSFTSWSNSWRPLQLKKQTLPWKEIGITTAGVLVVYGVLSTAYLHYLDYSRAAQLEEFGQQVNQRLTERTEAQAALAKIKAINTLPMNTDTLYAQWDIVGFFYLNDVEITRLRTDYEVIEMSGRADSATEVASKLSELANVSGVEFTSPVRKSRGQESFEVRIALRSASAEELRSN